MRDRFSPRLVNPNVALGRAGEKSSAISSSVTIRMTCMYRWSTWLDTYRIFIRLRRAVSSLIIYNYGAHIYKHTFQNPSWLHFGLPGYRVTHVTLMSLTCMHVPTQICTFEGMCYYKRLTAFFSNLIMMVTVSVYLLLPLFITVRMYVPPIKYKVSRTAG